MGKKFNDTGFKNLFRIWLFFAFPNIAKKFNISFQDRTATNYFYNVIKNAIDYRKKNNIQRNDFVQMLLQLKEKGSVELKNLDVSGDYLTKDLKNDLNSNTEMFGMFLNVYMLYAYKTSCNFMTLFTYIYIYIPKL